MQQAIVKDDVMIEYIGDPPVLDELTRYRILIGEIPPQTAAVIRGASMIRSVVLPGVTLRIVDPDSFGTSREYRFGPYEYSQPVAADDVDKILGSSSGHQFRRVGDPMRTWVMPHVDIKIVSEVEGTDLSTIFPNG